MTPTYPIRAPHPSEIPRIQAIERRAAVRFRDYGLDELFASIITAEAELLEGIRQERLWVAADDRDEPVGFALACTVGVNAHLDELDVLPEYGRRGSGTALVERVIAWAGEQGLPGVTLTTLRHVPWNAPYYERLGFRVQEGVALSDELRGLLKAEIALGLPAEGRVAMRLTL